VYVNFLEPVNHFALEINSNIGDSDVGWSFIATNNWRTSQCTLHLLFSHTGHQVRQCP